MPRPNERSLSEALKDLVQDLGLRAKLDESAIRADWETIVGGMIARHTTGLRLLSGRLHVKVDSAPLRQEMTYMREDLRLRINEKLGREVVREVVVE
jgi:predicted nucleic acid-binding Zn ribbon protein